MEKDYKDKRDELTGKIIGICYEVHNLLGPGFVEKIYFNTLKLFFDKNSLKYEAEKEFEVKVKNKVVGKFKVDFLIENKVILEIKSVEGKIPKIFESQVISYLKAAKIKVGLLINFGNTRCEVRRLMV